jgi:hypothetical protein
VVLPLGQWKPILAITVLKSIKNITQQAFGKIANFVVNSRLHFSRIFIFNGK